ncbi:hypothetical protein FQR65_LT20078 [Abscondita terminalis]|nr:hypothetical protein FQR65_LT20078 [Abscondita terminalis]
MAAERGRGLKKLGAGRHAPPTDAHAHSLHRMRQPTRPWPDRHRLDEQDHQRPRPLRTSHSDLNGAAPRADRRTGRSNGSLAAPALGQRGHGAMGGPSSLTTDAPAAKPPPAHRRPVPAGPSSLRRPARPPQQEPALPGQYLDRDTGLQLQHFRHLRADMGAPVPGRLSGWRGDESIPICAQCVGLELILGVWRRTAVQPECFQNSKNKQAAQRETKPEVTLTDQEVRIHPYGNSGDGLCEMFSLTESGVNGTFHKRVSENAKPEMEHSSR